MNAKSFNMYKNLSLEIRRSLLLNVDDTDDTVYL